MAFTAATTRNKVAVNSEAGLSISGSANAYTYSSDLSSLWRPDFDKDHRYGVIQVTLSATPAATCTAHLFGSLTAAGAKVQLTSSALASITSSQTVGAMSIDMNMYAYPYLYIGLASAGTADSAKTWTASLAVGGATGVN